MIKIDRHLIAAMSTPDPPSGLATALVRLGDTPGLRTVARASRIKTNSMRRRSSSLSNRILRGADGADDPKPDRVR
jgi:EAL domain-containing protein (putative c-di-GMP-specific phosphodiesterase class I)